jgi:hypothetical protein
MCPEVSPPLEEQQSMLQLLEGISRQLKITIGKQADFEQHVRKEHQSTLQLLEGISQQLKMREVTRF